MFAGTKKLKPWTDWDSSAVTEMKVRMPTTSPRSLMAGPPLFPHEAAASV
jgi:hypothetical protein